jgi:hypothetical protein
MPKKPRERYKDRNKVEADPNAKPAMTLEALKRRRLKRFLIVGLIGISFPILELIAYQFRAITISFTNRSEQVVRGIKVEYDGGAFDIPEILPGGVANQVIRPNFSFKSSNFATYLLKIRFAAEDGGFFRQMGRVGSIDFSAKELYTIQAIPPENQLQLQHDTRPGFPLSLIRDLMLRLGFG